MLVFAVVLAFLFSDPSRLIIPSSWRLNYTLFRYFVVWIGWLWLTCKDMGVWLLGM